MPVFGSPQLGFMGDAEEQFPPKVTFLQEGVAQMESHSPNLTDQQSKRGAIHGG